MNQFAWCYYKLGIVYSYNCMYPPLSLKDTGNYLDYDDYEMKHIQNTKMFFSNSTNWLQQKMIRKNQRYAFF